MNELNECGCRWWTNFQYCVESKRGLLWFWATCSVLGPENPRKSLGQLDATLVTISQLVPPSLYFIDLAGRFSLHGLQNSKVCLN